MNSSCNDAGELVLKPFRMCSFVPFNVPIIGAMMLAPPTMLFTALSQATNQSYNAGLNYGNKNSTCNYTNADLAGGFFFAISSSVAVGLTLRKMTTGMTKGATGSKMLFFNFLVGATASGAANFCNTMSMRYAEISKGIKIYEDPDLTKCIGVS